MRAFLPRLTGGVAARMDSSTTAPLPRTRRPHPAVPRRGRTGESRPAGRERSRRNRPPTPGCRRQVAAVEDALQLVADDDVRSDHHVVAPDRAVERHADLGELQPLDAVLLLLELPLDLVDARLVLPQSRVHVRQLDRDLVLTLARIGHVVAPVADEVAARHRLELAVEALQLGLRDPDPVARGRLGGAGRLDLASRHDSRRAEGRPLLQLRDCGSLLSLVDPNSLASDGDLLLDAALARLLEGCEPLRQVVPQAAELLALGIERLEPFAGRLEFGERGRDRG
jgi:hypothetical protein